MAVVQGDVRVTVGVTGKGDTTVVKQAAKDIDGLGAKIGTSMKSSVDPVNKVKEGFERLRGNVLFVAGAASALVGVVGEVVSALIDLVSGEDKAARAMELWGEHQKDFTAALEKGWGALEKFTGSPVEQALSDVNTQLAVAKGLLGDLRSNEDEWTKKAAEMEKLRRLQAGLESDIARDTERTAVAWARIKRNMEEASKIEIPLLSPFTGNDDSLNMETNNFGEPETPKQKAAREKRLADKLASLRRSGGGGGEKFDQEGFNRDNEKRFDEWIKQHGFELGGRQSAGGEDRTKSGLTSGNLGEGSGSSAIQSMAADIRDFSAALSDSLPGMDAFTSALGQISQMWGEYAETGKGAARATIMSVGAIAMAGAEQIKNERLRAGVLSIIHLGLGTALMFVPGSQAEAAGHLAGAAILGSVAIFGGGGGGSKSSAGSSRTSQRNLSDRSSSGGWTVNIYGGWFGTSSPQETAAELHARMQRGAGSGFVPSSRAA